MARTPTKKHTLTYRKNEHFSNPYSQTLAPLRHPDQVCVEPLTATGVVTNGNSPLVHNVLLGYRSADPAVLATLAGPAHDLYAVIPDHVLSTAWLTPIVQRFDRENNTGVILHYGRHRDTNRYGLYPMIDLKSNITNAAATWKGFVSLLQSLYQTDDRSEHSLFVRIATLLQLDPLELIRLELIALAQPLIVLPPLPEIELVATIVVRRKKALEWVKQSDYPQSMRIAPHLLIIGGSQDNWWRFLSSATTYDLDLLASVAKTYKKT